MRQASFLAGTTIVLGLTLLAAPGQAAAAGGLAGGLAAAAGESTQVEQVRHRCYRHRGHWHCPSHRHYRRYYGPGIYFNFGPRHHHHGHRHYRRHWHR
jgi:hypothetical protein